MGKRPKKAKRQLKAIADAFSLSMAVDSFALAFEGKHRKTTGTPKGTGLSHVPSAVSIALQLSHGKGDTKATNDPLVWWKEVAYAGTFFKGDQRIDISPHDIKHWAKTHKAMSKLGIKVPVPIEHTTDPEKGRGRVLEMAAKPNAKGIPALYAKIKFRDAEAARMVDSGTSIFVPNEAPDGLGRNWVRPVQHVALTDYPVIPNLEPFTQTIALSNSPIAMAYNPNEPRKAKGQKGDGQWTGGDRSEAEHLGINVDSGIVRSDREKEADSRDHVAARKMLDHARGLGFTSSKWAGNHDKDNIRLTMHGDDGRGHLTVFDGKPGQGTVKYEMQLPFSAGSLNHKIINAVVAHENDVKRGVAMSHTVPSFVIDNGVLVMDAMSRPGARDGISLAFPPNAGEGKKEPDGDEKSGGDKPPAQTATPGPGQNAAPTPAPNGATQKITVQDLAAQLGIGQGVTDEQQLLTLLSNTIMQLKARAQAPMPPQPMPGQPPVPQQPGMPHPQMMPGQAPGQPMVPPRPPMPQGAYGPPAMHTGRPPVAMSKQTRKEFLRDLQQQQEEGISLSLEDIPQEIVMALSKKQMKKVIKTIKKAKGGVSGPKDVVQKLNDKSHFGMEEEGGDDTYECDNDSFGEEDIEHEGDEEKKFNPSGMAAGGLSQLTGSALDATKNARTVIIDDRFRRGFATAAVRKNLIDKFVEGQGVALSHHYDDGFNFAIAQLDANGPVLNLGKSGPQGAGVVALSNGELGKSPLEADADRRAEGRSSL